MLPALNNFRLRNSDKKIITVTYLESTFRVPSIPGRMDSEIPEALWSYPRHRHRLLACPSAGPVRPYRRRRRFASFAAL